MNGMLQSARLNQLEQCLREELVDRINRAAPTDGRFDPFDGIYLARSSVSGNPASAVMGPSLCVIAQGGKEMFFGEQRCQYDPYTYLLTTVELPVSTRVMQAS
ncbi:AraC family transcriptional regulator, partial [bacterium]